MKKKMMCLFACVIFALTAAFIVACDGDYYAIRMSNAPVTIKEGQQITFEVVTDGFEGTIEWISSDNEVLEAYSNGYECTFKAVGIGEATITASAWSPDGAKLSVSCTVTVTEAAHTHTYSDDWSSSDEEHWHAATCDHDVVKDKADHEWDDGEITTAPTCDSTGVKTFTCEVCDKTKTESVAVSDAHEWDDGEVTTAATCTTAGVKTITCENCDETKTEPVAANGAHVWDDGEITTAATCTTAGVKTFTCENCDETKTEPVAAEHTYSDEYSFNATHHWFAATCAHTTEAKDMGEHEFLPGTRVCGVCLKSVPTTAAYKIEYYLQDETDKTQYAIEPQLTVNKSGTIGANVAVGNNDIRVFGDMHTFKKYVYDEANSSNVLSASVAADGTSVLKLYYKIKTFTLTFKVDGEVHTTRTVDYGATLTDVPAVPDKTGYTGRWDVLSFADVIADDEINAVYTPDGEPTRYTIEYYYEDLLGAYNINSAYTLTRDGSAGDTVVISSRSDVGFEFNDEHPNNILSADLASGTVLRAYYKRKQYVVTFMNGTQPMGTDTVKHGGTVSNIPSLPTATDYYNYAWDSDLTQAVTESKTVSVATLTVTTSYVVEHNYASSTGSGYQTVSDTYSNVQSATSVSIVSASDARVKPKSGYTVNFDAVGAVLSAQVKKNGTTKLVLYYDYSGAAEKWLTPDLGGSFNYSGGVTVNSLTGNSSVNSDKASGTLNGPSYLFNNGTVGSIYYAEATFNAPNAWVGILINTLDGIPDNGDGWYGYGMLNGGLYLHEYINDYEHGTVKKYLSDVDSFKLGVARVHDYYYVYLDGSLILSEKVVAYSTFGANKDAIAADNASGVGLFIGSNADSTATFTNFRVTTDISTIMRNIVKSGATIEYDDTQIAVSQLGQRMHSLDYYIAGETVSLYPQESSLGTPVDMQVTYNGTPITLTKIADRYEFKPAQSGAYVATVEYAQRVQSTLNLTVKSAETTLNGTAYSLYDGMTVNPADVNVSISGRSEQTCYLTSLTQSFTLTNGNYTVTVTYGGNKYAYDVVVNGETSLVGYVSPASLGGSFTSNGINYASVSYAWSKLDGRNDSVTMTDTTLAFQGDFKGTQYYVEGVFDSTDRYIIGNSFAGMLVSHNNSAYIENYGDHTFGVTVLEGAVVGIFIDKGWETTRDMFIIANYDEIIKHYDPKAVKLGVVRDGINYWFYVNGQFVATYSLPDITTESGVGIIAYGAHEAFVIKNFNYSANASIVSAAKAANPITANSKNIDVYFMAGQSNAAGISEIDYNVARGMDEKYVNGYSNIYYGGNAGAWYTNNVHVGLARVGLGESWSGEKKIGAELGMAERLSSYYNLETGRTAAIIKQAVGGTSLANVLGPDNDRDGNWYPPSLYYGVEDADGLYTDETPGITGGLYRAFLNLAKKRVDQLKAMGYTVTVKGMWWMQGENDIDSPTTYAALFKALATDIRKGLTSTLGAGIGCENMPIFVGEVSRSSGDQSGNRPTVCETFINVQRAMCTPGDPTYVDNCHIIASGQFDIGAYDSSGTDVGTLIGYDKMHWNYRDMLKMGRLLGDSILENVLNK